MAVRRSSSLLALAVALGFLAAAPRVAAQDDAVVSEGKRLAAQEAYRQALELFDHAKYADALAEFKRAYALAPSFRISYNIGLCHAALGDSLSAVTAFGGYLREGGERIPAARRHEVEAEMARLSKQLAWLSIQVDEPAAEASVDGVLLAKGPFSRQIQLNSGRHDIAVRGADGTIKTQSVSLTAGGQQELHFQAPVAASPPTTGAAPAARSERAGAREVPWLAWGVTGALGASAAVTGVLALSAHGHEGDLKTKQGLQAGELSAARDKVENLALATDILLVGTAVAAGVSLYFTLRQPSGEEPRTALVLAPGSVRVFGRF